MDISSDPLTNFVDIDALGGIYNQVKTEAGIGSIWDFETIEKTRVADDQRLMIFFPGMTAHPNVILRVLADAADADSQDIPGETYVTRVKCVGGPFDDEWFAASFGILRIYVPGPDPFDPEYPADPTLDSSYEVYCHVPGDPSNEFRHAITYLVDNTPGANETEIHDNMVNEREEVDAWRSANYNANNRGNIPPQISTLSTPADRVTCQLVVIRHRISFPSIGP